MSNLKYLKPENFDFCLSHAIEECGEFLAAAGKTQRWGLESVDPTLPPGEREHNGRWLLRELDDVEGALKRLRVRLAARDGNGYINPHDDVEWSVWKSAIAASVKFSHCPCADCCRDRALQSDAKGNQ